MYFPSEAITSFQNEAHPKNFPYIFPYILLSFNSIKSIAYRGVCLISLGSKLFSPIILFIGLGLLAIPDGIGNSPLNKVSIRSEY